MEFDYVIVGGGSAGCVMAARLSEDPAISVCLIEAGGEGRDLLVRAPMGVIGMISGRPKINNYAYKTTPQKHLNNRRGFQPRGRALGGSSAINAMIYIRGHQADYDEWAANGATGWSWSEVLPYFLKSEGNSRGADALRGADGPLSVSDQRTPRNVTQAFLEASDELQLPRNDDFNGPQQQGVGLWQVTQFADGPKAGQRCSAAAAYLHDAMTRPNLHVITKARVERITFDGPRATGVDYSKGGRKTVHARREVILCAGAFGSPQLLQASGIGPAVHLRDLGIPVIHDAAQVGGNLQDHLDFVLSYKTNDTNGLGLGIAGTRHLLREILKWRKDGTGMIASPGSEAGAFLKTDPNLDRPDVQLHFVPAIVDDHVRKLHLGYGYSCHACILRPKSRGTVRLASANMRDAPLIDPNFLSDERDAQGLLAATKLMRRIMDTSTMQAWRTAEIYTDGVTSDEELMQHIRARADTIYHPVGTCRMGTDTDAPCDPQGRVNGVAGLRVVDASLMPTLIGGNTNAPTIMMAEKIAAGMHAGEPVARMQ
ncbi:Choline dehydrogenase [Monaibacterium marinum]|uniref:Choline dehydrogenase n=1 Tax=Pontivivens marinum TaxID=1690039 RepID=A0A2C9CS59_9RHOB|nr:FAD-dependent oxidoreductase [Monaibacterium marinum]SOH94087.1 Choline dehydrogenase [Monaibacterium marinum]